jgi:protein involved in polysaccharide export with SLBB domain
VGTQVGVIGSVNQAAVFELAPGEGVADALRMAGGFSAVADRSRLSVERLQERTARRVAELALPRDAAMPLSNGDVLFAFSAAEVVPSTQNQNKRVRVDGEVLRPGEYVLPPGSTLQEALRAAGGLTSAAFIYGTQFTRDSVRQTQQENYDRALRDLETDITRAAGTQRVSSAEQAASSEAQAAATSRLLERLRALKPSGRVVLSMATDSSGLPELLLEDGDRLYVPPKPSTVGVFGSVFNTGSYLHGDGRTLSDYLRLAGGPTKGADESSIFVVRANGQVISGRQRGGDSWFRADTLQQVRAEPGDTLFVPEEMDKTTFVQAAKDWTQILYQFGIGIAGIVSASR